MRIHAWWLMPVSAVLAACGSIPAGGGNALSERPVPGTYSPAEGDGYLHITAVAPGYAGRDPADRRWFIYLAGYIDTGATARLERVLDREQVRSAILYFDSPGGHVVEAMALGRLLRERQYATSVGSRTDEATPGPGRCYSACPIAFAGGVSRSLQPGSVLGIHRAENRVPVPDELAFQRVVTGQMRDYLAEMGVSGELVAMMSAVPGQAIRDLTNGEAVQFGLVNADSSARAD
jgi:hypothetical protein